MVDRALCMTERYCCCVDGGIVVPDVNVAVIPVDATVACCACCIRPFNDKLIGCDISRSDFGLLTNGNGDAELGSGANAERRSSIGNGGGNGIDVI